MGGTTTEAFPRLPLSQALCTPSSPVLKASGCLSAPSPLLHSQGSGFRTNSLKWSWFWDTVTASPARTVTGAVRLPHSQLTFTLPEWSFWNTSLCICWNDFPLPKEWSPNPSMACEVLMVWLLAQPPFSQFLHIQNIRLPLPCLSHVVLSPPTIPLSPLSVWSTTAFLSISSDCLFSRSHAFASSWHLSCKILKTTILYSDSVIPQTFHI